MVTPQKAAGALRGQEEKESTTVEQTSQDSGCGNHVRRRSVMLEKRRPSGKRTGSGWPSTKGKLSLGGEQPPFPSVPAE